MAKSENHFRDRKFCLLLYPDDETHVKALKTLEKNYDIAYILHNRDKTDEGETKKHHWHVVVRVGQNAVWNTALASELGITPNYIQQARNIDRALMYLIHYNDKYKAQYDVSEVKGNLVKKLKLALVKDDKTEQEKVAELMEVFSNNLGEKLRFTDIVNCAMVKGYYEVVRRATPLFKMLVDEHNKQADLINYRWIYNIAFWCFYRTHFARNSFLGCRKNFKIKEIKK